LSIRSKLLFLKKLETKIVKKMKMKISDLKLMKD